MRYIFLLLAFWGIIMGESATAQDVVQKISTAQSVAVKTNLLYGAYTLTPNLGVEAGLNKHLSLDFSVGYNPWNRKGAGVSNRKAVHWLVNSEVRYWLDRPFEGHFFGAHALYSFYNISGKKLPLLLGKDSKRYRYEGFAVGGGLSYGYRWPFARKWSADFTLGLGYARLRYDRYDCARCGEKNGSGMTRNYFGPARVGISLIYLIR